MVSIPFSRILQKQIVHFTFIFCARQSTTCLIFSSCITHKWCGMSQISGVLWWNGTPSSLTGSLKMLVFKTYRWCTRNLMWSIHHWVPNPTNLNGFQTKVTVFFTGTCLILCLSTPNPYSPLIPCTYRHPKCRQSLTRARTKKPAHTNFWLVLFVANSI